MIQMEVYTLTQAVDFQEPTRCEFLGFPGGASGKESACQCRRHKRCGFNPWVGKIPCRRAWQPIPVFLPERIPWTEEPGRLWSIGPQSQTRLKRLSMQRAEVSFSTWCWRWGQRIVSTQAVYNLVSRFHRVRLDP